MLGFMLDRALAREMFYAVAACLALAIVTVIQVRRAGVGRGVPARQRT
jgi:hypothetical protein